MLHKIASNEASNKRLQFGSIQSRVKMEPGCNSREFALEGPGGEACQFFYEFLTVRLHIEFV